MLLDPRIPTPLPAAREEDRAVKEFDNPEVESQIEILQSRRIQAAVVSKLKLYDNIEFTSDTRSRIHVLYDALMNPISLKKIDTFNKGDQQPTGADSDSLDFRAAVDYLRDRLEIERVKLSYILDISFTSLTPEMAALVANSVTSTYIEDQLATRSQIASEGAKWLEERINQLRRKVNEAALQLQEFRAKRSDAASQQTTLDEVESTASAYRKLYESYLQAYIDAAQRQALPSGMARIITQANPPIVPSHPRKGRILAASIILGLLASYGIAALRHFFDTTVRGARQIEKAGITYLGELRGLNQKRRMRMIAEEPLSQFSYDIRRLERTLSRAAARTIKSLGVTPVSSDFGASEVSYNLAHLYATAGNRVVLIDANLLKPTLTQALSVDAAQGLADIVLESAEVEDCIIANAFNGVDFLPAGIMEPSLFTTWSFSSSRLQDRLGHKLETYDVVIINLPAAFSPATLSLARLVEAIAIVTRSGCTNVPIVAELISALECGSGKFAGVAVALDQ
jgi:Mrp family chromosome partitioning ATPase